MNKTAVDWFSFRTQSNPFKTFDAMMLMWRSIGEVISLETGLKGMDGWVHAAEIKLAGDEVLGRIDYDGESQRGWTRVTLTGKGCGYVMDWTEAYNLQKTLDRAEIRRLDLALDTYAGECSHEKVIEAHRWFEFSSGGRQPAYRTLGGSDSRAGKTIYVGKRAGSDKMLRCYEKGYQLLADCPASDRDHITRIDNHPVDTWYRVEVEFKAASRPIPWDALRTPDTYFAGAYPFCANLIPDVPLTIRKPIPDLGPILTMEKSLDHCRRAYGGILRAAVIAHGYDMNKVMGIILSDQPSHSLVAAGVLTVVHP